MTIMLNSPKASGKKARHSKLTGAFLIVFLVFLDQMSKYLAVRYLKTSSGITVIPGFLKLRYLENRGMAFGLLQDKLLFLILVCLFFFAPIFYLYLKTPANTFYSPLLYTVAVVFSGAMGNFIDRVFRRYVVDFIYFSLIDFPTFNIADIYVTCGIFVLIFLIFFRYKGDHDFDFLKPGQ